MKKQVAFLLAITALAVGVVSADLSTVNSSERVDAANVRLLELTDNFNGAALDAEYWETSGGVEQRHEYSALRLNSVATWGSYAVLQKAPLDKDWDNFTVTMEMNWQGVSSWTGIFFGNPSSTGLFSNSQYFLHINSSGTVEGKTVRGIRLCARDLSTGSAFYSADEDTEFQESTLCQDGDLLSSGEIQKVVMQFVKTSEEEGTYSLALKYGDATAEESDYQECLFEKICIDGYMGFTTYSGTVLELRKIQIVADGQEIFADDFEDGDISFQSAPSSSSKWRGVGTNIEERTYCGKFCTVSYEGVTAGNLAYTESLSLNVKSEKSFEISYDLYIKGLEENTFIGSAFALADYAEKADTHAFIGLRKAEAGYQLACVRNGEILKEENLNLLGHWATVSFIGYYDNSVEVLIGGNKVATFSDIDFNGYTAVSAVTVGEGNGGAATIDNYSIYTYDSVGCSTEDMAIDFKGVREYELVGEMVSERYINTRKWVMYGGVKSPIQVNRNYIQFHDISGEGAFVCKARYGDQITRFDFKISALRDDVTISDFGYSFGRKLLDSSIDSAPGVFFRQDGNSTLLVAKNMTTAGGSSSVVCPLNVYKDADTWYTCMLVISSRTVKVFLKEQTADDSSFGRPIAVFTNVDSYGYGALTCGGTNTKAYYYATNFSIVNIDPMQEEK